MPGCAGHGLIALGKVYHVLLVPWVPLMLVLHQLKRELCTVQYSSWLQVVNCTTVYSTVLINNGMAIMTIILIAYNLLHYLDISISFCFLPFLCFHRKTTSVFDDGFEMDMGPVCGTDRLVNGVDADYEVVIKMVFDIPNTQSITGEHLGYPGVRLPYLNLAVVCGH